MTYLTPQQLSEYYPCYSVYAIRGLIANRNKNGFSVCIRRIGKKILINIDEFEKWIEDHK